MNNFTQSKRNKINLFVLLLILVGPIVKAALLAIQTNSTKPYEDFFGIWSGDFQFIAVMLLAVIVTSFLRIIRIPLGIIVLVLSYWYLLDVLTLLLTDGRAGVLDIFMVATASWAKEALIKDYLTFSRLSLILLCLALSFVSIRLPRVLMSLFLVAAIGSSIFMIIPFENNAKKKHNYFFQRYNFDFQFLKDNFTSAVHITNVIRDSNLTRNKLSSEGDTNLNPPQKVVFPVARPNIIFVVVESFSAAYSHRASGIFDYTPKIDRMSEEGMLFTNYFAIGNNSFQGILALLMGKWPIPSNFYKNSPLANMYQIFQDTNYEQPLTKEYQKNGYAVSFFTGYNYTFGRDSEMVMNFVQRLDLDAIYSPSNEPYMNHILSQGKDRGACALDTDLYQAALSHLENDTRLGKPILYIVETAQSHRGFLKENLNIDNSLSKLYQDLKLRNFFDNGWLVITADHRDRNSLTDQELDHYGDGATAQVPLIVIGNGVPAGIIDRRLFQHSDLLRKLGDVPEQDKQLSEAALFIDYYRNTRLPLRIYPANIPESGKKGFNLSFQSSKITWSEAPQNKERLEECLMQRGCP